MLLGFSIQTSWQRLRGSRDLPSHSHIDAAIGCWAGAWKIRHDLLLRKPVWVEAVARASAPLKCLYAQPMVLAESHTQPVARPRTGRPRYRSADLYRMRGWRIVPRRGSLGQSVLAHVGAQVVVFAGGVCECDIVAGRFEPGARARAKVFQGTFQVPRLDRSNDAICNGTFKRLLCCRFADGA